MILRRLLLIFSLAVGVLSASPGARAQTTMPQPGDPPVLAQISISPDAGGTVTITGGSGAVFANAHLAVRNLYTGETVTLRAGSTGSFTAALHGTEATPYLITPSNDPIDDARAAGGSLPGGPGAILFRQLPKATADGIPFSAAGSLTASAYWSGTGLVNTLSAAPGTVWQVALDLRADAGALAANSRLIGAVALQPIAVQTADGVRAAGSAESSNGWSSTLTPGGLPVDNVGQGIALGEITVEPQPIAGGVQYPFRFDLHLPADLPPGLYAPTFQGYTLAESGDRQAWANGTAARLPLVLSVGGVTEARLPWALFADDPSDGSRGILPDEDQGVLALSNRVRFDSPVYVLPPFAPDGTPIAYPLEPYLLDQLPNRYGSTAAPLIPFQFPGEMRVQVTRPDGSVDNIGAVALVQNQLSTPAEDERARFGAQSPVDEYRLAALDPAVSAYHFDQYGDYTIALSGNVVDAWNNRYSGGGTYHVVAAELLDLTPATLPGTPFEVGDAFAFGLHVAPGVPADVTVTLRVYPLDGGDMIERTVHGQANRHGYFQPDDAPFVFTTPGEYVIDYTARYTAANGALWAASARGAGVIAAPDSPLIGHGARGIPDVDTNPRPAWFSLDQLAKAAGFTPEPRLSFPYHAGDVLWIGDGSRRVIVPQIRVQDSSGAETYTTPIISALTRETADDTAIYTQERHDELPVTAAEGGYIYVSAVRPNVTVRQFVAGSDTGGLPLEWDGDDPLNRQIGAGLDGTRPGDFIFLFGGAILRTSANDEAQTPVRGAAIYAALAVITDSAETPRIYPPDRGAAGGGDGGALLTLNGAAYDTFFHLTGVQPGEVLRLGNTVAVAGQVAPTVPAQVTATFTAPSGRVHRFTGTANAIGYYYDPAARFTVDETGVWTVDILVQQQGQTSAGMIDPPAPEGGVLGAANRRFSIYVLPPGSEPLAWNPLLTDSIIPVVSPYNFSFTMPEDWRDVRAYYTMTTPGYILEDGALRVTGRSFNYSYSAALQVRAFPNLENTGRIGGAYATDVRTLTFVATGIDGSGAPQIRSRTFTILNDRLITMEGE